MKVDSEFRASEERIWTIIFVIALSLDLEFGLNEIGWLRPQALESLINPQHTFEDHNKQSINRPSDK